jgi:hypothetical protein
VPTLYRFTSGDAALVVRDRLILVGEPGALDADDVENAAERLAEALQEGLTRIEGDPPASDDWTWEDLIATGPALPGAEIVEDGRG